MTTLLYDLSVLRTDTRTRGIGRYIATLGQALAELQPSHPEYNLVALTGANWPAPPSVSRDLKSAVHDLCFNQPRQGHAAWAYRFRLSLAKAARALKADLVHHGHPNVTPLGNPGCPRVITAHDLIPLRYSKSYLDWRDGWLAGRRRLDYRRYTSADHLIAVSKTTANDLVTLLGVSPKKISVVYNGVDLAAFSSEAAATDSAVRAAHGLADKAYVLYVGGDDWRKNYTGMLKAVLLARRQNPNLNLVLAWASKLNEYSQQKIISLAEEAGCKEAVQLLGYVSDEDLSALSRQATAQLFISHSEGFGYPVIEAMATGCPVITSNLSSMAEIAEGAAILVSPSNHAAIADAILQLSEQPSLHEEYRAKGLAHVQRFSTQRMARDTFAVYEQLLS